MAKSIEDLQQELLVEQNQKANILSQLVKMSDKLQKSRLLVTRLRGRFCPEVLIDLYKCIETEITL